MAPRNRVTPTGALIEAPGTRGLLMGNRGILKPSHYDSAQPAASGVPWIACLIRDRNGVAIPPTAVKYTKLFFLDEVTAFAVGHRPCGGCQRHRYAQFVDAWCAANRRDKSELDRVLMTERRSDEQDGRKPVVLSSLSRLPSGVMVQLVADGTAYLLLWGRLFPWSASGYGEPIHVQSSTEVRVLTPPSIVSAFQAGFPLPINSDTTVHPTVLRHGASQYAEMER